LAGGGRAKKKKSKEQKKSKGIKIEEGKPNDARCENLSFRYYMAITGLAVWQEEGGNETKNSKGAKQSKDFQKKKKGKSLTTRDV